MARKGRSDSKLDQLEPEVRQDLIDKFLHENISLAAAKEWLVEDHEVSISSSGLHGWFQRVVWPLKLEMRKQRATMANALISEAQGQEVDWNAAVEEEIKQKAYEMLATGMNPKQALAYSRMALSIEGEKTSVRLAQEKLKQGQEKLKQDERRLQLLEQKAAKADEIEALMMKRKDAGGGLTDETLAEIEKALGM